MAGTSAALYLPWRGLVARPAGLLAAFLVAAAAHVVAPVATSRTVGRDAALSR